MTFLLPRHNPSADRQQGLALMPMVLAIVISGALMGMGLKLVGPRVDRMRARTVLSQLDQSTASIVAWSRNNRRLPTAAEFAAAAGIHEDPWKKSLVYVYDDNLAATAAGGVCGRESTGLSLNGAPDMAFAVISGGKDFIVNASPSVTGSHAGNLITSHLDFTRGVSLDELRNRAGCFGRTAGRLAILNNELPEGCSGKTYDGDLFAEGGVAPFHWAGTSSPAWLVLTPSNEQCHLTGAPPSPGTDTFEVTLTDATGAQSERFFNILVGTCSTGPGPISQWDFDEGSGTDAGDGVGDNDGTLRGDTAWSDDTPDGTGSSLYFDGEGDYAHVPDSNSLHITGEVTLMAWVKETAIGQFSKVVSRRTGNYFYFLGVDNGHPYGGIGQNPDYTVTGKSLLMSLNRWNHLAVVYNDAEDRMFLHFDGTERMTSLSQSLPAVVGVDLSIGADDQGSVCFFEGDIDDVAVFNRALTDSEIRSLFYGTAHANRVAGWSFNGTTEDAGVGGHAGVLMGASYTTDRFGTPNAALSVDGGSCVRIPDHPDFRITGEVTLTAWIRERRRHSIAKVISRRRGTYFYFLGVDNGRPYAGIGNGSSYTVTRKSIRMLSDKWHFIAMVYNDAEDRLQIYFDGTLDETATAISLPDVPDVDLTIGADFQGTQNFFTGYIDQVMVFDRALDAGEIRDSY